MIDLHEDKFFAHQ